MFNHFVSHLIFEIRVVSLFIKISLNNKFLFLFNNLKALECCHLTLPHLLPLQLTLSHLTWLNSTTFYVTLPYFLLPRQLHLASLNCTLFHLTSLHFISLYFISFPFSFSLFPFSSLHFFWLNFTSFLSTLFCFTLPCLTSLYFISLHIALATFPAFVFVWFGWLYCTLSILQQGFFFYSVLELEFLKGQAQVNRKSPESKA